MNFWSWLLGRKQPTKVRIDWLDIEARVRQIDEMLKQSNQLVFKQSVIEFDKLIDSIMKSLAEGDTFADRLKALRSQFSKEDYNQLWKAHIKRNELVHDSGSYVADWELTAYMRTYRETVSILRSISLR